MRLKKILITNFRSYGEDPFILLLSNNANTIIGENNVGKTTILEALKKILLFDNTWEIEDFFIKDSTKKVQISIECILDDEQIAHLAQRLYLPYTEAEFTSNLSNELTYTYTRESGQVYLTLKIGFLFIENGSAYVEPIDRRVGASQLAWSDLLEELKKDKSKPLKAICEDFIIGRKRIITGQKFAFNFQSSPNDAISKDIISIIAEKTIILEEFREKPQIIANKALISPTGKDLANILDRLKNGPEEHRKKYAEIQKLFQNLFPHLKIEFLGIDDNKKIEIQKGSIFSTTNYIGSGVIQTLFILTHIITHSDKVLCIDTPEIQLHPHIQRRLGKLLQTLDNVQIIIITHSQYFLPISQESKLIRFIQNQGKTIAIHPPNDYFTDSDFNIYDQILTVDNKEFFFSRLVLLVEGLSDQWVMQVFSSAEGFDLDERGISIVPVNGKTNFLRYPKILEGYQIPWIIMADTDKKREIFPILEKVKEQYPQMKSFVLRGEIEHVLDRDFIIEGKRLFGDGSDDKNKPLIARYAAKKMVESGKPIPDEIKRVISALKNANL